ncbi:MAG TPA: nucleoside 2-deoxyribosyltransferase [Anaerolineales bacterium]
MNIYFACSITGGREFEAVYQDLTAALLADGHEVPTAHLADSTVVQVEGMVSPLDVYQRDVKWIEDADALVAEVSVPSHGVGYEVGFALHAGKRVLCLSQQGRKVSKMISGNPDSNLLVRTYQSNQEAVQIVRGFINGLKSGN